MDDLYCVLIIENKDLKKLLDDQARPCQQVGVCLESFNKVDKENIVIRQFKDNNVYLLIKPNVYYGLKLTDMVGNRIGYGSVGVILKNGFNNIDLVFEKEGPMLCTPNYRVQKIGRLLDPTFTCDQVLDELGYNDVPIIAIDGQQMGFI